MSEPSMYEKGRAASEARDTVAARPASSSATAITAAMRRYLAAEQYRELSGEDEPRREKPLATSDRVGGSSRARDRAGARRHDR